MEQDTIYFIGFVVCFCVFVAAICYSNYLNYLAEKEHQITEEMLEKAKKNVQIPEHTYMWYTVEEK